MFIAHKCLHCAGIEPATSCVVGEYSHHYAKSAKYLIKIFIIIFLKFLVLLQLLDSRDNVWKLFVSLYLWWQPFVSNMETSAVTLTCSFCNILNVLNCVHNRFFKCSRVLPWVAWKVGRVIDLYIFCVISYVFVVFVAKYGFHVSDIHLVCTFCIHTYRSRLIPKWVEEASQIFLWEAHVLRKLLSYEEYCRCDRW
jgi:hypothetical protein